ncbi:MAG TPA: membrane protein insertion efficiency factor YidD [Acidobacteriota bacterium]|nr:membrane protein insertion efficiency factor YidD [Acidobacteriota bacterium]
MIVWRVLERLMTASLIVLIRGYQLTLAPLFVGGCRHQPTCSAYAIEALQKHGPGKGIQLAAARLWRCRPRGTFGYDPVP